jgi:putative Mn2+ efflux pump MntP
VILSVWRLVGFLMLGASFALFIVALPRHGEVVGFLRERHTRQTIHMMAVILLFVLGGAIALSS